MGVGERGEVLVLAENLEGKLCPTLPLAGTHRIGKDRERRGMKGMRYSETQRLRPGCKGQAGSL